MKFRSKITKEFLLLFYNIILNHEKSAKKALIFLTERQVQVTLISDHIDTQKCFTELLVSILFMEYRIESQSNNTILFEVIISQLLKALSSGKYSITSLFKLVKRDNRPYLCFETKANESILSVDVIHDIPIKLMKSTDIAYHMPPIVSPPSVALDLPKGKLSMIIINFSIIVMECWLIYE